MVQSGPPALEILECTGPRSGSELPVVFYDNLKVGNEMDVQVRGRIYGSKVKTILPSS